MAQKGELKPVTSGDIEFSRNGEKPQVNSGWGSDSDQVSNWALQDAPPQTEEFVIYKLVDNTKEGGVHLHMVDDVMNPKTKKIERIRCLAGVDTIWMSEQKDLTPDYVKNNQRTVSWHRGAKILRINKNDTAGVEYMTLTNSNIGKASRKTGSRYEFFEYNPKKQQEEALKREMLEIEMAIQASKEPVEAMKKHANYLGIQAFDEFGIPKEDEGIRREYILMAKRNSQRFKETLGSKEVEVSYLIKKAISKNLIDLGGHSGDIKWGAGGFICKVPFGRNTHEYLVELALNTTSEDGKKFLSQLQDVANK